LIGIDYVGDRYELNGCVNDINNMNSLISSLGFKDIKVLKDRGNLNTSSHPTAHNIKLELDRLCNGKPNQQLYAHYAGHGIGTPDNNGDEIDGRDECLVPKNYTRGYIRDDDIALLIRDLHKTSKLDMCFDCCHSGTICDLPYNYEYRNGKVIRTYSKASANPFLNRNDIGEIVVMSGCLDKQTSKEIRWLSGQKEGAFSGALRRYLTLNKNASCYDILVSINRTVASKGVRDQTVVISSNVDMSLEDLKKRKFFNGE
jgi:hypothetical protein